MPPRGYAQKGVVIPWNAKSATVEWTVDGALEIDETSLVYGKWNELSDDAVSCMTQPNVNKLDKLKTATD